MQLNVMAKMSAMVRKISKSVQLEVIIAKKKDFRERTT